jgi:formate dehydrogenase accessory protein FdhD
MTVSVPVHRNMAARRVIGGESIEAACAVAEETPVALVYNGVSHVVMMATPADLEDFALGFSLSEGILADPGELLDFEAVETGPGIEARLTISSRRFAMLSERHRNMAGRTGCGICGVDSLDQVMQPTRAVSSSLRVTPAAVQRALAALPELQKINQLTRSIHAAAWADRDGMIRLVREDVGRHNALDKLIGALAARGLDRAQGFALLTSRCSFELVQKAMMAGIPMLAAISAPTALAVRLAEESGIAIAALVRPDGFVVFAGSGRIVEEGVEGEARVCA